MNIWAIILAAGKSSRLGGKTKKQFLVWKDRPIFWHSVLTFSNIPSIKGIILVFPQEEIPLINKELEILIKKDFVTLPIKSVGGGSKRQESSYNGLMALPRECSHVLIHDAARPFVTAHLIQRIISALVSSHKAVVPGIKPKDTIKQQKDSKVITIPRDSLYMIQTPQGFDLALIKKAYDVAQREDWDVTDDASLVELMGEDIFIIEGEEKNIKITTKDDLKHFQEEKKYKLCVGFGYDVHKFGGERPLKLGGIKISDKLKVYAHSDGDILIHALIDAILGCLSKGDIGDMFPDSDPRFDNMSSGILLSEVMRLTLEEKFVIEHVDITIITQIPKISPYKRQIQTNVANLLNVDMDQVNIKATTEEGLGFTGEKMGIKCMAQVIGYKAMV